MPNPAATSWEDALAQLAKRDGSVEITPLAGAGGAQAVQHTYRVRLLAHRPTGLAVDYPSQAHAADFQRGAIVQMLVVQGNQRWEMLATALGRVQLRLNDQTTIPALMLARPHEVRNAQRRSFFRVSTAGVVLPAVRIQQVVEEGGPPLLSHEGKRSPTAGDDFIGPLPMLRPIKARLLNIGGGGIGVSAAQGLQDQLRHTARCHCTLDLPSLDQPLEVPARLVHLAVQRDGDLYLGLRFEPASPMIRRRCEDQLCQFTSWLQRQQLQRLREKR